MFLRPHYRRRDGQREAYWALVESYRTERGPRQRTVAYLGLMDEAGRLGIQEAADPPSSSEQRQSALSDLLGVPIDRVDDNRLYRGLDRLLPHKAELEVFLKQRFGELFAIEYDLLLYDVTSTYFEGQAKGNPLAQRGYSRDHRSDCKQVCIGLVVTRCGLPLGYEIFAGNRHDSTTLEEIVTTMEARYGRAQRIWALDRGMVSQEHLEFLRAGQRQYIVGTPKSQLKQFQQQLLSQGWHEIRDGLEVKLCPCPAGGNETYILCRSRDRREKEQAMHARFEERIEEGLIGIAASCRKRAQEVGVIERRVGRLLGQNTRAAGLFDVQIAADRQGAAQVTWRKVEAWRTWAQLSEGAYVLRSNVSGWSDEDIWRAYIQLTEAETAFRIHKSDLSLRPVWHQKEERVRAHILVCFLAYVLWKFLGQLCQRSGLGDEPRRVLSELAELRVVDVVLPTKDGQEIRTRCVTQPGEHQRILLQRLNLHLPSHLHSREL
jgi:transposase